MRSMNEETREPDPLEERLSDAVDGRASRDELDSLLAQARLDPRVNSTWHCYQLIGDVLRSEELAGSGRDRAFVVRLRARLATEPVMLAPGPVSRPASPQRRRPHLAIGWAAACVLAVTAGFLGFQQGWKADESVASLPASSSEAVAGLSVSAAQARSQEAIPPVDSLQVVVTPSGQMIRDSALDMYLQAHRQAGSTSTLPIPAGFVRNASDIR